MMERPWFVMTWAEPSQRPASIRRLGLGIAAAMALLFVGLQGWWVSTAAPGLAPPPAIPVAAGGRGPGGGGGPPPPVFFRSPTHPAAPRPSTRAPPHPPRGA